MNPSALPLGTVIRVGYPNPGYGRDSIELERIERGWAEVNAHCVDCAACWYYESDGLRGDLNATASTSNPQDLDGILEREGTWEVVSVPATWLSERLQGLLRVVDDVTRFDVDEALRELALDSGLS